MYYGNVSATNSSNLANTMVTDTITGFDAPVPKGVLSNGNRTWSAGASYSGVVLSRTFEPGQFFEMVTYWAHDYRGYGMIYGPTVNYIDWNNVTVDDNRYWGDMSTSGFGTGYSGTFFGQYHAPIAGGGAATTPYWYKQSRSGNVLTLQYSTTSATGPWTDFTTSNRVVIGPADRVAIGMGEASSTQVTPLSIVSLVYSGYAVVAPTASAPGAEQ